MIMQGTYLATHMRSHLQIAEEPFRIEPHGEGFVVESQHLVFGRRDIPERTATIYVDSRWIPTRAEMTDGTLSLDAVVADDEVVVRSCSEGRQDTTRHSVDRKNLLFVMPGTLHIPLYAVRRLLLEGGETMSFQAVPDGVCSIEKRDVHNDKVHLWMQLVLGRYRHSLDLVASPDGDLLSYNDHEAEISVELES